MTIFSEPPAVSPGNVATPERGDGPVTSRAELDAALADLANHRDAWAAVGIPARIALVDRLAADTAAVAARWIELECERRHLDRDGQRPATSGGQGRGARSRTCAGCAPP